MIFVGGNPISTSSSSSEPEGSEILTKLLEHPVLVSASNMFKSTPERKISQNEDVCAERASHGKHVYVFQREYATVEPAFVESIGTDEATTCAGIVIRNPRTGMTSVAHMDSPHIVDMGLTQMLALITDQNIDTALDVHLIGAYEDALSEVWLDNQNSFITGSQGQEEIEGYSFPLCSKIVEALQRRPESFHIQTLCVLRHNTERDIDGNTFPVYNGFLVDTLTGFIRPASFDRSTRCPDEIVRRIRVAVSSDDPSWKDKLLETYNTHLDRFHIAACSWDAGWKHHALSLQQLSDSEILLRCSTSPLAEEPDFVANQRRLFDYLFEHPDWRETFPMRMSRVFRRINDGSWITC